MPNCLSTKETVLRMSVKRGESENPSSVSRARVQSWEREPLSSVSSPSADIRRRPMALEALVRRVEQPGFSVAEEYNALGDLVQRFINCNNSKSEARRWSDRNNRCCR